MATSQIHDVCALHAVHCKDQHFLGEIYKAGGFTHHRVVCMVGDDGTPRLLISGGQGVRRENTLEAKALSCHREGTEGVGS
jgi:hypothetical protein